MALVFGVSPGARGGISLAALYSRGTLPASLLVATTVASIDEALARIVGTVGEWGELGAVGIAAPLTWSGTPRGAREVDALLRKRLPTWAPRSWVRPPVAQPTGIALQGPALTWGLASEIRAGQLPRHSVFECHPRVALARLWPDRRDDILGYVTKNGSAARHVAALVEAFADAGILRLEDAPPATAGELEALVAALTALGVSMPEAGFIVHELAGGDLRPVGRRPVVLLESLP